MPFESLDTISYSLSVVTMDVSGTFVRYSASKNVVTMKTGLGFIQVIENGTFDRSRVNSY